jgi:AcrR family transcriptional regulator
MERRARKRQETAVEIVDAAERIVLADDLSALTVHAIAAAVGVTPGALYRYFPSRDAIVAAVQLRVIDRLVATVVAAIDAAPAQPLARIRAVGDALVAFARAEPTRYALLAAMMATPRPLVGDREAADVLPAVLAATDRVRALFSEARVRGALSDGDDVSRMVALWAAVHGAIQLDKLSRFAPELAAERVVRDAVDGLLAGWRGR